MTHLALVGAAHIHTPNFIKRILDRPETASVTRVWDHDDARATRAAEKLGAKVSSLDAIWHDAEVSGVVICAETRRHEELVTAAARAGKHLFVEKPLGFAAADAWRMAGEIDRAGVLFQTGYFMRSQAAHLFLKEQIDAGLFGKITRIRASNYHDGAMRGIFDGEFRWMADADEAGCGGFGDLGTHGLDLMLWLGGSVRRATGQFGVALGKYPGVDEYGEALLDYENGAVGSLAAGWVDLDNPATMTISGTEAHAAIIRGELFLKTAKLEGADGKTPWTQLPPAQPHAFEQFLDAVSGESGVPLVTPQEAAERSAVMEAIYRAAKAGTWEEPTRA